MSNVFYFFGFLSWFLIYFSNDHYFPWVSWHAEVVAGISISLVFVGTVFDQMWLKSRKIFHIPGETKYIVLLVPLAVVHWLMGKIPFYGELLVYLVYIGLVMMAAFVGYSFAETSLKSDGDRSAYLACVLICVAVVCSTEAMIQALNVWDQQAMWIAGKEAMRRPGSNLSQPNHLATVVVMGIASLLYLMRIKRLLLASSFCLGVLLSSGLIVSESRTGLLSLATLLLWFWVTQDKRRLLAGGLVCTWIIFVVLGYTLWPIAWNDIQINGGASGGINLTTSGRVDLWMNALAIVAEKPLAGWGVGQFAPAQNFIASNGLQALPATYAHNLVLDLLIWFGVPIALSMLVLGVSWFVSIICNVKSDSSWFCIAALLPFFIHSALEFPHAYLYFLIPVGILVGMLSGYSSTIKPLIISARYVVLLASVLLAVGMCSIFDYFHIEEDFRAARFSMARVGQVPSDHTRPNVLVLNQLSAMVDLMWMPNTQLLSAEEIERMRAAAFQYPWRALIAKYAIILAVNGRESESKQQVRVIEAYFGLETAMQVQEKIHLVLLEENRP